MFIIQNDLVVITVTRERLRYNLVYVEDGGTGGDYWGVEGRTAMHIMRPIVPISLTTEPVASISK